MWRNMTFGQGSLNYVIYSSITIHTKQWRYVACS
jgi:hypothetical protein